MLVQQNDTMEAPVLNEVEQFFADYLWELLVEKAKEEKPTITNNSNQ